MKTPIFDFADSYAASGSVRFHMPGHKGKSFLGIESYDITEISGADTLYCSDGIIAESENYASELFGTAHTFYSTEGSTLAIKAMLAILKTDKKRLRILAARGAHKAFIYAAALLDLEVDWIFPDSADHLCKTAVTPAAVEARLSECPDTDALYLTSPDYLGGVSDIKGISSVCKKHGVALLVDNAHGAYLNFLSPTEHPIALGADMVCDSAHKTLPALTGGAYLHISNNAPKKYLDAAARALRIFASTSPSYLILASLDLCNKYIVSGYRERLSKTVAYLDSFKKRISSLGFSVYDTEPLKMLVSAVEYGYTGTELASYLSERSIEIEYSDSEYAVFMVTPENTESDFETLYEALSALRRKKPLSTVSAVLDSSAVKRVMSIRDAVFSEYETVSASLSVGRICAAPTVCCPPAVPIAVSGELINENMVELFKKYNIKEIEVVKND